MTLRAIRLDHDPAQRTLYRHEFGSDLAGELTRTRNNVARAAFIVRAEDVPAFLALRDVVVHCSKKPDKPLSGICLGLSRIPLATGAYVGAGQFLRSVRALLSNSAESGDENVYLVAGEDPLFEVHWRAALTSRPRGTAAPQPATTEPGRDRLVEPGAHVRELIRLLPDLAVPAEVEQQYLGSAPAVRLVHLYVVRAAANDDTVLILGPTGTGKEIVARLIHSLGPRRGEPFIPVNCGAIPGELFESELFGAVRGAHGGSSRERDGLWQAARGGTLFLDEVGDLAPEHQVKLLRALDERAIRPVGAADPVPVTARVLSATNKDLGALMRAGRFREDLYYRLRAFTIPTPSLRDHPDDIPLLARTLWRRTTRDEAADLGPEIVTFLQRQAWPGNVRELLICLTSVFNLFGASAGLRVDHFRAVLGLDRHLTGSASAGDAPLEPRILVARCLRCLRQAMDAIRDAQIRMRNLRRGRGPASQNFRATADAAEGRANELELLCAQPAWFRTIATFLVVEDFKERLRGAVELLREDVDAGLSLWTRELEPASEHALRVLFEEVGGLMKER